MWRRGNFSWFSSSHLEVEKFFRFLIKNEKQEEKSFDDETASKIKEGEKKRVDVSIVFNYDSFFIRNSCISSGKEVEFFPPSATSFFPFFSYVLWNRVKNKTQEYVKCTNECTSRGKMRRERETKRKLLTEETSFFDSLFHL